MIKTELDIKIHLPKKINQILDKYRQMKKESVESCGILIGSHSKDGKKITIEKVTEPTQKDIREHNFFKMDPNYHQAILNNEFVRSQKEFVYLGTWHSHPEAVPIPSRCDINDWYKQYAKNKMIFEKMIFMIIGQKVKSLWLLSGDKLSKVNERHIVYE